MELGERLVRSGRKPNKLMVIGEAMSTGGVSLLRGTVSVEEISRIEDQDLT